MTLPVALLLGVFFIFSYLWAVNGGQFDDLKTPAHRALIEDENCSEVQSISTKEKRT